MEKRIGDAEYVLTLTRAILTDPKKWTQGGYGHPDDAQCASGALSSTSSKAGYPYYFQAYEILRGHMNGGIPTFNDTHTHAEVLAAFDAAIAEARRLGV
jgi:hypothetical protein